MRERNRKKKFRDQELLQTLQETNPNIPEIKIPYPEPQSSTNLLPNQKIPYNQKVEQDLCHWQLSEAHAS